MKFKKRCKMGKVISRRVGKDIIVKGSSVCGVGAGSDIATSSVLTSTAANTGTGTGKVFGFGGNVGVVKPVTPKPTFWETDIADEMVQSCGIINEPVKVSVSQMARAKMNMLMDRFKSTEWLAYLIGDKDNHIITDIILPKQRVTSVNVYVDEPVDVPIIGVIHSHHDMGNNFSHTDDGYINQNHDLSLCITHSRITGQIRVKTECGRYFMTDVNVINLIDGFDIVGFEKEIDEQIKPVVVTYPNRAVGGYVGPRSQNVMGNTFAGCDLDDMGFETDLANDSTKANRDLIPEIAGYTQMVDFDIKIPLGADVFEEFTKLVSYIDSMGTEAEPIWEERCFESDEKLVSENFLRLVDEISLSSEEMTDTERVVLTRLRNKLYEYINDSLQ